MSKDDMVLGGVSWSPQQPNIERAQLATLPSVMVRPKGWGYLPFVRVNGVWQLVGMRVWDTAPEAVACAREAYTKLGDEDIRACFAHPGDDPCHCVRTREKVLVGCRRCGGTGHV